MHLYRKAKLAITISKLDCINVRIFGVNQLVNILWHIAYIDWLYDIMHGRKGTCMNIIPAICARLSTNIEMSKIIELKR